MQGAGGVVSIPKEIYFSKVFAELFSKSDNSVFYFVMTRYKKTAKPEGPLIRARVTAAVITAEAITADIIMPEAIIRDITRAIPEAASFRT